MNGLGVKDNAPSSAALNGTANKAVRLPSSAHFDAEKHLCFEAPTKKWTFEELGYAGKGITPVAITEPFPLFTRDAVNELRKDCLSTAAHEHFRCQSHLAAYQVREYHPKIAPFLCQALSSPEFVAACSQAAGIELVPIMPLELGHTNFQVGPDGASGVQSLPDEPSKPFPATSQTSDDDTGSVGFHRDSYPWVAVTMLSDTSTMIGGETGIKMPDGSLLKLCGPGLGNTIVMQGGFLVHQACKASNAPERISMVTSFRAKDSSLPDPSVLHTIRPITKANRINAQWSIYRLRLVADRMNMLAKRLEDESKDDVYAEKEVCSKQSMQAFVDEQEAYLRHGIKEMM